MKRKRMKSTLVLSHLVLDAVYAYKEENNINLREAFERLISQGFSNRFDPWHDHGINRYTDLPY
jgi:hypothetical protein